MTSTDDLALAHRLADAADAIALHHFAADDTTWRTKDDGSPVSAADEQIELAVRAVIQRERPADAVLGEEFGAAGAGQRRWIIDAVDGTASFLAREPEFSTLIALEEAGAIILGLVTAPALQRRWWAGRTTGAWTRSTAHTAPDTEEPLVIDGAQNLTDASIGIWPPPARLSPQHTVVAARVAAAARTTRPTLDWADPAPTHGEIRKPSTGTGTCHGALLVATGQLDAFLLLGAGPWDVAPLVPIIEEAGGSYDDLTMNPRAGTVSALFTNHALRHQILDATNHSP